MVDLNDIFDDIALAENNSYERGFEEGVSKSRVDGFAEGYGLGLGKGLQIGTTIGFYRQFAELTLLSLQFLAQSTEESNVSSTSESEIIAQSLCDGQIKALQGFPTARKEKLEQSVKNLLQQIDDFSLYDCEDEAIFAHLERIESKYKQTKALLNLKLAKSPKPPSKDLTF